MNLFFFQFTYAQFHVSEKKVNENKISKQITDYVEKNYKGSSAKYYELKTDNDSLFYEAKVKSNQERITLIFNSKGEFLSIDSEVHYLDVPEEVRKAINNYLSNEFSTYKVTHCRDQKMGNRKIYELDVQAKKNIYKYRFEHDGTFVGFKEAPQKTIDLIFN